VHTLGQSNECSPSLTARTTRITSRTRGPTPAIARIRIPRISYLAHTTGSISSSRRFSTGTGTYQSGTIHADFHAGVQDEFNFQTAEGPSLIKLCLIDGAKSVDEKHPRCGQGP
jgi:hypothetical protein